MSLPAAFPASLDALANPTPTTNRDDPGFELDLVIARIHDILEALEAKVGVTASLPAVGGGVLRMTGSGTSLWGKAQTADIGALQITTALLASGAASQVAQTVIAATNVGSAGLVDMAGASVSNFASTGGPILAGVFFTQLSMVSANALCVIQLQRNGAPEVNFLNDDITTSRRSYGAAYVIQPAAGTYTFKLQWNNSTNVFQHTGGSLWLAELKK